MNSRNLNREDLLKSDMDYFSNAKVYVIHYKSGKILKDDALYQPLMCGDLYSPEDGSFTRDNTGENISHKNKFFSELSGIYWIWKNTSHSVTGLCHYRRFFTAKAEPFYYKFKRLLYTSIGISYKRYGRIYTKNISLFLPKILDNEELSVLLSEYDAILPQARKLKYSVEEHYRRYHDGNDLKVLEAILTERYPEYLEAFRSVLREKSLYANNMFILKNPQYQKFMAWWFEMLFEFEKRVDMNNYSGYQERIMGFVAERLLTIWFKKEQLKCKELQLIYFRSFKYE